MNKPLLTSKEDLSLLIQYATKTHCGDHPLGGNYVADAIQALFVYVTCNDLEEIQESLADALDAVTHLLREVEDTRREVPF